MADETEDNPLAVGETPLDALIIKYESGGRNIPNYMFDPTHTAQGIEQITNSTWREFAPKAGVSLEAYPTAMSAPPQTQLAVGHAIQAERGIAPWANYNPQLAAALKGTGFETGLGGSNILSPQAQPFQASEYPGFQKVSSEGPGPSDLPNAAINLPMGQEVGQPGVNPIFLLGLIQSMMKGTTFTPVDYDPWKVVGKT